MNGDIPTIDDRVMTCTNDSDCLAAGNNYTCRDTSQYKAISFGSTADTGCEEGPYDFETDYTCPMAGHVVNRAGGSSPYNINWDYIDKEYGHHDSVCVYQPRVQALDNWGWCSSRSKANGGCDYSGNSSVKGYGCYSEAGTGGGNDQCRTLQPEPWVKYNGYIVVIPSD